MMNHLVLLFMFSSAYFWLSSALLSLFLTKFRFLTKPIFFTKKHASKHILFWVIPICVVKKKKVWKHATSSVIEPIDLQSLLKICDWFINKFFNNFTLSVHANISVYLQFGKSSNIWKWGKTCQRHLNNDGIAYNRKKSNGFLDSNRKS